MVLKISNSFLAPANRAIQFQDDGRIKLLFLFEKKLGEWTYGQNRGWKKPDKVDVQGLAGILKDLTDSIRKENRKGKWDTNFEDIIRLCTLLPGRLETFAKLANPKNMNDVPKSFIACAEKIINSIDPVGKKISYDQLIAWFPKLSMD